MLRTLRSCVTAVILSLLCGASAALGQGVLPTATLTVNGTEQQAGGNWDSGNIEVDFNGFVEFVGYGQYSSNASLAAALAGMFVRDYHSFGLYAKAGANGSGLSVITFQLANGSAFGPLNVFDPSVSFTLASSGFGSSTAKTADTGVATLTINGAPVAVSTYGDGSTAASIAQDLALKASSSVVAVSAEGPNLYLQAKQQGGSYSDSYSLSFSTNQSFSTSTPASGTLTGSTDAAPSVVYSYSVTNYAANGNLQNLSDSVMGTWAYNYDDLNRLTSGTPSAGPYTGRYLCWNYDSFGNRTSQSVSTTACNANPPSTFAATYSANNQISSVTAPASTAIAYDGAGNVTDDGVNTYTYDAEGRVCALNGPQGMIGYQYDADGNRVGKGTVTTITTCDITANGYTPMTDYVLDQSGGQMTEMAISGTQSSWVHSNVTADGQLIATYDNIGYGRHFYLNDPLGSRRVQTDPAGIPELTCQSLPFGDQLYCTGSLSSPTEHHFTGKERDAESGLDYFGARYYASNVGRWMSPDWSPVPVPIPYANLADPQTLNLYSYTWNNPLSRVDIGGHESVEDIFNNYHGNARIAPPQNGGGGPQCGASNCTITMTILSSHPIHQGFWGRVGSFFSGLFSPSTVHAQEEEGPEEALEMQHGSPLEPIQPGEIMPSLPPRTWNLMTEPGPLGTGSVAQSFAGGQYSEFVVPEGGFGFNAYRVWGGAATLEGGQYGTYYSPLPETGGLQSMIDNAINPAWGNNGGVVSCVNLAPGTTTYVGISASQGGAWVGGNVQIYVPK